MDGLRRHYRTVKTVLRRAPLVDPFFVGKFSFSPYQACAHGCLYCDGRAERYWVEGEFDRDIVIRSNAALVLADETATLRERGIVFVGSGISDGYQPPEIDEMLMPACGRILADHRLPVTILTKSGLVRRDIDLWAEVNERAGFTLMVSLITLDDRLRSTFEPAASPVEERLSVLAAFKERGCAIGVAAMPLLPFLADGADDLGSLAGRLKAIGVDFVLPGGLTLRPGRQKETFFETLRRAHPGLTQRYQELYAENRPSGAPLRRYAREQEERIARAFTGAGLTTVVPHRIYRGRLPVYDEVYVLLHQMMRLYSRYPQSVKRLETAMHRYRDWLSERKKVFNRRRRLREGDLSADLRATASSEEWICLLDNVKLASFLRKIVLDRSVFDERTLRLD